MTLDLRVTQRFLERHPDVAAPVLEQYSVEDAVTVLDSVSEVCAARLLERVTATPASRLLAALEPKRAAQIVDLLNTEVAARYLRRTGTKAGPFIEHLPEAKRLALRSMLSYPEGTAGALLDPQVLAVPEDASIAEVREKIRVHADHTRYNVYVTDRDDRLTGVLNLRELLLAQPERRVSEIASREVMRLQADADAAAIVAHPGWRKVHSLPVVDGQGCYLGAIRYVALRKLQDAMAATVDGAAQTAEALGSVFSVGLAGMLDLLAGAHPR